MEGRLGRTLFSIILLFLLSFSPVMAAGKVISVAGLVELKLTAKQPGKPLVYGDVVKEGDTIVTNEKGKVRILFDDRSIITLGPKSRLQISRQLFDKKNKKRQTLLKLIEGKLRALVPKVKEIFESRFEVETPNAIAGVRGTYFLVKVVGKISEIITVSGSVVVSEVTAGKPAPGSKSVVLKAGTRTQAGPQGLNTQPAELNEQQIEQEKQDTDMGESEPNVEEFNRPTIVEGPPAWQQPPPTLLPVKPPPNFADQFLEKDPTEAVFLPPPISQEVEGSDQLNATSVNVNVDTGALP